MCQKAGPGLIQQTRGLLTDLPVYVEIQNRIYEIGSTSTTSKNKKINLNYVGTSLSYAALSSCDPIHDNILHHIYFASIFGSSSLDPVSAKSLCWESSAPKTTLGATGIFPSPGR